MKASTTTLQKKLARLIVVTSASILLLTTGFYLTYEYVNFKESAKSQLEAIGQITAANSLASLRFDDAESATEILQVLKKQKDIQAAALFDTSGKIFAGYPDSLGLTRIPSEASLTRTQELFGEIEVFQPVTQDGRTFGTLYLRADTTAVNKRLILYAFMGLAVVSMCTLLAILLSRRLQKSITTPIINLAEIAKMISEKGDYSVRAVESRGYEAALLTNAFNQMLGQIEVQNKKIIHFSQDLEKRIRERTKELENTNLDLGRKNDFIEKIFDSTVDLIAVFDSELNYVSLNRQAYEAYNITPENILGKHITDIYPSTRTSGILADLEKALTGEFLHNPSYKSPVLNRYFENFYIPMKNERGDVYRILTIAHDTTLIMQANDNLKILNSELAKSNQSLEQFAYITSHDLQEPLRKIQTFAEISETKLGDPEALRRYLSKINTAANRMSEMVKSVLNYSRLSQPDKEFETVSLDTIVDNAIVDLEIVISERRAVIDYGNLPSVRGIPIQLSQLFLNLISNSIKFCRTFPHIVITASDPGAEEINDLDPSHQYVKIAIADNGIGFEQQYAAKLFNIFQRLHNPSEYAGTGIGLALCRKIVENHKGKIFVESKLGAGSTFFVFLPGSL